MPAGLSIGERIRAARKNKGLSQAALAVATGIAQPSLSEIESGSTNPRRTTLKQIARELGADLGEPWLRTYLRKKPTSQLSELVEAVCEMVGDNDLILGALVLRLAARIPEFQKLLDHGQLAKLSRQMQAVMELTDQMDVDSETLSASPFDDLLKISEFFEGLDDEDIGGEVGPIEHAEMILAPVVARIEPGPRRVDQRTVNDEELAEMERRLEVRKRKTG